MSATKLPPTEDVRPMFERPSAFVERLLEDDPWKFQVDPLDSRANRQAWACARQIGKTRMCAWRGLHKPVTTPGTTTLITAPTQRQSSELFDQVKTEITNSPLPDAAWDIERETRTTIEFKNGSRVLCLPTGVDGKTIRGYTADLIIVDEAAFVGRAIYEDVLEPMLATTGGTMILASTPFGTSGFFYDAFHDEDWYAFRESMHASPLIDEEYIERQKRTKSNITYQQEVLGEFVESADAFLPRSLIKSCTVGGVEQQTDECYLGVDLARHGADASVFLSMDGDGNVFHTEHTYDKPLTDGIGRVKTLEAEYGYASIQIDETGLGAGVVDALNEDLPNVEGVTFTIDTKQSLYNALKERMEAGEITLPGNRQLRQQLADLEYELTTAGKMKIHHPEGGHDDFADGLALANWGRTSAVVTETRRRPGGSTSRRQIQS